jgi:hypothetical protein
LRLLRRVGLVLADGLFANSVVAQQLQNPKVAIEYSEPRYSKYYYRLKQHEVLERLSAFLSPLRLERPLTLIIGEGGDTCAAGPNAYYDRRDHLVLCYSYFAMLDDLASQRNYRDPIAYDITTPGLMPGVTREEVLVGGTIEVALHELGHAIFDNLKIPRLGREEDAADQIASFIMLQFGTKVALTTVKGAINVSRHFQAIRLLRSRGDWPARGETDAHSLDIQRANNLLCIAYGSPEKEAFRDLADKYLTERRKQDCDYEYKVAKNAFDKLILPRVDLELMNKVRQMEIFRPSDFDIQ